MDHLGGERAGAAMFLVWKEGNNEIVLPHKAPLMSQDIAALQGDGVVPEKKRHLSYY